MDGKAGSGDRGRICRIFEGSPIPIIISRLADGTWIFANDAMLEILGYRREEVIGRTTPELGLIDPAQRAKLKGQVENTGKIPTMELDLKGKGGRIRTVLHSVIIQEIDGELLAISTSMDITERKTLERFRDGQNRVLEQLALGAPIDGVLEGLIRLIEGFSPGMLGTILILSKDGKHIGRGLGPSLPGEYLRTFDGFPIGPEAGSCGTAMYRRERVIVVDIGTDPLWTPYRDVPSAYGLKACWSMPILSRSGAVLGSFAMYHRETRTPAESELRLIEEAAHLASLALDKERTEAALEEMEAQYLQAQKMEAVGLLAGGIAHDFNNLLTAVNGYSEMAMQGLGAAHPAYGLVREILKAGDRAASLTRQLLAYSRKQMLETRVWDLNAVLTDLMDMLQRFIGEDVILAIGTGPEPQWVAIDRGQMEQVIVNLVVNARDAMPRGGRVDLQVTGLDAPPADLFPDAPPGACVMLTVADTGTGMTPEVRSRIFEPFFTTKDMGGGPSGHAGTGLGLSVVHGIVTQSGGRIEVRTATAGGESPAGRTGTAFHILLPRAAAPAGVRADASPEKPASYRGGETLLLVEDDLLVRNLVLRVLQSLGYRVLQARNGVEALEILDREPGIGLVISDVVMPDLGGRDLADRIRELRPGLPVLLMSGHAERGLPDTLPGDRHAISKPFSPTDFARKVREILDMPGRPASRPEPFSNL